MANETWKVITPSGVNIRSGPSTSYAKVGVVPNGSTVTVTEKQSNWVHVSQGWMCCTLGTKPIMSLMGEPDSIPQEPTASDTQAATAAELIDASDISSGYIPEPWFMKHSSVAGNYDQSGNGTIRNINAILGVPYQFLPNTDTRIDSDGSALGRVYASKIVSKMPVLIMTPGTPDFMTAYSKKDKKSLLATLLSLVAKDSSTSLDNVVSRNGRYYTLKFDHVRYFNYVNPMCRIAAQYLGIGNQVFDGVQLKNYNWGDGSDVGVQRAPTFLKKKLESFFNTGLPGCLAFYINSDTQISESFSNSTSESMLASKVNSISDMGKEINFLLGYSTAAVGVTSKIFQDTDVTSSIENINDMTEGLLGKHDFLGNLTTHLVTVARGGRLIFPEIWNDSSFSRSYDIDIKLVSPDPDKLSVYFNVIVPLLHLIALVAPQSIDANPNGYCAPFLVRAVYKGLFNVDMGIITNMSITKGAEGGWTKEGIPTVVDVNFTIKDLYDAMSITDMMNSTKYDTMNNTSEMDYIANLCGINIFKPEVGRALDMWFVQNVENRGTDALYNIWGNIEQGVCNKLMQLYTSVAYM